MANNQCVLLADDDRDEAYLLRYAFTQNGLSHQVIDVPDGALVIDYLKGAPPYDDRAQFPLPRLLMLDLKMPKVNGFDVLLWMGARAELRSLPVVVLSSSVFAAEAQRARQLGAREFLTKPHDLDDLIALVKGLHERWLVGDHPPLPVQPVFDPPVNVGLPRLRLQVAA